LRRDSRWPAIRSYLQACAEYWAWSGVKQTLLVLPHKYDKSTRLNVVVWLHLTAWRPEDFAKEMQGFADDLHVAMLSVSGTLPKGKEQFIWAEDAVRDARRIDEALAEVSDRIKPGLLIALGFSQGAQVGLELAVRDPEKYAGAIVLSPAPFRLPRLDEVTPSPLLAKRGFVLACGAQERASILSLTTNDARWLEAAGAQLEYKTYPKMSEHSLPPDFLERLPEWVRFIEKAVRN
jgi:predicted esterase